MTIEGRELVIFGCGSQALYVIEARAVAGLPAPVALVDIEKGSLTGQCVAGIPVRHACEEGIAALDPVSQIALVAHGDNRRKLDVVDRLAARGARFVSVLHPRAGLSPLATVDEGCIICAGCEILPGAVIEAHVIVHAGAVVDHDCRIGRGANLAPGVILAGRVTVGEGAYVYSGAVIAPRVKIGAWATVGAGAVVRHDVAPGAVVAGNPARPIAREA